MTDRKALYTLFLVVFIDLLGFGIVIPILPYYAQTFGANAFELGLLMMIYSLMQFFFAPVWGSLSDRYGRKPILVFSILGASLTLLGAGLATTFWGLFIARFFGGISGANISTAYAFVADVTSPKDRSKGMGLMGAGFGLGFIFGPAIGGILSQWGYATPLFFGSALAALNGLLAWKVLKEPKHKESATKNRPFFFSKKALHLLQTQRPILLPIGLFFLVTLAATQLEVLFAFFVQARFGFEAREAGMLLAFLGFSMALVQGVLVGPFTQRFGMSRLIQVGFLLSTSALIGFAFSSEIHWTVVTLAVLAVGNGLLQPSLSALMSYRAPERIRGMGMGLYHSASSLARVVGPLSAGFLYDRVSVQSPFLVGAGFLALGGFLYFLKGVNGSNT